MQNSSQKEENSTGSAEGTHSDVSLVRGGLLYRAQKALGLIRPNQWNLGRRLTFVITVAWLPLVLLTLYSNPSALRGLITSYPIGARLLIALPVLLVGQLVMDNVFGTMVSHIREAGILSPQAAEQIDDTLATLRRWRNSAIPEILLIALVYSYEGAMFHSQVAQALAAQASPWGVGSSRALLYLSPAGSYYELVSQPIYLFMLGVAFEKWLLWFYFLFRLSRFSLQLLPTHPDHRGGLGFLGFSPMGNAPIVLASCFAIGANWRMQILHNGQHLIDFKVQGAVLLAVILLFAIGPLIVFVPKLARLRRQGLLEYGTLSQLHSQEFHDKWILHRAGREEEFLAAPEVSTKIDLESSFENIGKMKPLPYDTGALVVLLVAIVIPMLPAVLSEVPLIAALKGLLQAVR